MQPITITLIALLLSLSSVIRQIVRTTRLKSILSIWNKSQKAVRSCIKNPQLMFLLKLNHQLKVKLPIPALFHLKSNFNLLNTTTLVKWKSVFGETLLSRCLKRKVMQSAMDLTNLRLLTQEQTNQFSAQCLLR